MKGDRRITPTGPVTDGDAIRVLHVDDEPDLAEMVATFLEREDGRLELDTASNASDGLTRLADAAFDCIVSDYDMPGRNGIAFLEAVRQQYPDLPFILYTGKGSEEIASDAISAGATDYLQKQTGPDQYTILANRIVTVVERARAQASRRRQLKAIETAEEGIAIFDSDGHCQYANQRYGEIYGVEPTDIRGTQWKEFYPPEEILYDYEEMMAIVDDEGHWRGQTTNVDVDGETFTADHTISTTDAGGFVCTTRPHSEREELEERLSQFETVVEKLTDPVYVCDEKGRFRYVNTAFAELVGYDRERIIGSHTRLIKNEYTVAEAERNLGRILSSDGPESVAFEVEIQPKSGDPIPCEDHMGVIPYDGPRFSRSVGVLRDISTRKQRERTLKRQNRQLEEFTSIVSHDLRNPLTVARGNVELLRDDHDDERIEAVDHALARMTALIDDLLDLARGGETTPETEAIDLTVLAEDCWQNVETSDATIRIETERAVRANRSQLAQVLENLIGNAIEHGGQDVSIAIGDVADGFYVEDDGTGIPPDEREEVFEPGYSTAVDGTGFGLPIIQQVADSHGWDVRVTESPDAGARFEITGVEFATP